MKPILFILGIFLFVSCANNSSKTNALEPGDSAKAVSQPNLADEGEAEFMANCTANAQGRFNDEKKAYTYCNCILNQIKQKYPNLDSASIMLNDTTQMMKLQANCK